MRNLGMAQRLTVVSVALQALEPGEHVAGVAVGREDGVEDLDDAALLGDEGQALVELAGRWSRRSAAPSRRPAPGRGR